MKEMSPYKALGLDGFQAIFYQPSWSTVGQDIEELVPRILEGGPIPDGLADALLVLIPKKHVPNEIRHFRPISLYNTVYKLVMKVLANRLKTI